MHAYIRVQRVTPLILKYSSFMNKISMEVCAQLCKRYTKVMSHY